MYQHALRQEDFSHKRLECRNFSTGESSGMCHNILEKVTVAWFIVSFVIKALQSLNFFYEEFNLKARIYMLLNRGAMCRLLLSNQLGISGLTYLRMMMKFRLVVE